MLDAAPVSLGDVVSSDWMGEGVTPRSTRSRNTRPAARPKVGTDPDELRPAEQVFIPHTGAVNYSDVFASFSQRVAGLAGLNEEFTLRTGMITMHTEFQTLYDAWQKFQEQVRRERITAGETGAVATGALLERVYDMMATCAWFAVEVSARPIVMPRQGVCTQALAS